MATEAQELMSDILPNPSFQPKPGAVFCITAEGGIKRLLRVRRCDGRTAMVLDVIEVSGDLAAIGAVSMPLGWAADEFAEVEVRSFGEIREDAWDDLVWRRLKIEQFLCELAEALDRWRRPYAAQDLGEYVDAAE